LQNIFFYVFSCKRRFKFGEQNEYRKLDLAHRRGGSRDELAANGSRRLSIVPKVSADQAGYF
jgi:hypothetical protein